MKLANKKVFKNLFFKLLEGIIIYVAILGFESLATQSIPPIYNGRSITAIPLVLLNAFLYKDKFQYYKFLIINTIIICSVITIKHLTGAYLSHIAFDLLIGFALGLTNFTLLIVSVIKQQFIFKTFTPLLFTTTFIPVIFIWSYFFISNSYVNVDTVLALFQTNTLEAKEYISVFANRKSTIILITIILLVNTILFKIKKDLVLKRLSKTFIALVIISLLSNCWLMYRCRINIISGPVFEAKKYLDLYDKFNSNKDLRKGKILIESTPNNGLYVLIIGESHSKNFTHAYGYAEETSPWLDSIKHNHSTLLFTRAHSCHVQTIPSVTYALTAKNQYNSLNLENALSLLECAEAAGFETAWVSNQFKFAVHDTPITVIADEANQQIWLNGNKVKGETQEYDGKIISQLGQLDYKENMLLIIHLMGSHSSYKQRYPENFSYFTPNSSLNLYNNSLRYTDYVIQQIYQEVSKRPQFKSLIYFSDHGEIPGIGHDTNKYNKDMTDIPFYLILSPHYIKENPKSFNILKTSQDKVFTNDLIFNTVLGIMNIKVSNTYEANNDLTNKSYDDSNRFLTLHGRDKI